MSTPTPIPTDFDMLPGEEITVRLLPDDTFRITRTIYDDKAPHGVATFSWVHAGPRFNLGVCTLTWNVNNA